MTEWRVGTVDPTTNTAVIPKHATVFVQYGSANGASYMTIADGADSTEGSVSNAPYTDSTGAANGTVISLLKGNFGALTTKVPTIRICLWWYQGFGNPTKQHHGLC